MSPGLLGFSILSGQLWKGSPQSKPLCVTDLQSGWRLWKGSQDNEEEKLFKTENKNATVL